MDHKCVFCAGIFGWVPALFMDKISANAGLLGYEFPGEG